MTTFGKVLAFVNLVIGVSLLAWAVSVYANRADWLDSKSDAGTTEGEITQLKKEIDRLQKSITDANSAYGQRATALANSEAVRHYRKQRLNARIDEARKGAFKVQLPDPNNPVFVDVAKVGGPILAPGSDKQELRGVDALVQDFNEQVRQADLHRRGDQPVQQNQWADPQALLTPERLPTLGIDDLRTLHGLLSDQVSAVEVAANKQRDVLVNLRNEAEHLTDLRVDWTTRLQTLERRQQQLENRLGLLRGQETGVRSQTKTLASDF